MRNLRIWLALVPAPPAGSMCPFRWDRSRTLPLDVARAGDNKREDEAYPYPAPYNRQHIDPPRRLSPGQASKQISHERVEGVARRVCDSWLTERGRKLATVDEADSWRNGKRINAEPGYGKSAGKPE